MGTTDRKKKIGNEMRSEERIRARPRKDFVFMIMVSRVFRTCSCSFQLNGRNNVVCLVILNQIKKGFYSLKMEN